MPTTSPTLVHAALDELCLEPKSDVISVNHNGIDYFACFVEIGEGEAANILRDYNGQNRHRTDNVVLKYAEAMRTKAWQFNGASVVFSLDPIALLDGQHRLEAVVVTRTTQLFLAVWGVPFTRFTTIDTGMLRKLRQALQTNGRDFADIRARVVSQLFRFERGYLGDKKACSPTIEEGLAVHQTYQEDIDAAIRFVTGIGNWQCGRAISKDLAAVMYVFMARKSPKVAAFYLGTVIRNQGPDGSAVPIVVSKLNTIALAGNKSGTMLRDKIAALCSGWNSFANGNTVSFLKSGNSRGSWTAQQWLTALKKPLGRVEDAAEEWLTRMHEEVSTRSDRSKKRYQQHWTGRAQDASGHHAKGLRVKLKDRLASRKLEQSAAQEIPEAED